jgi:hypothetical protein
VFVVCLQTGSEWMDKSLWFGDLSGVIQRRRWGAVWMLLRVVVPISGSFGVGWGRGGLQGRFWWVVLGCVWGWGWRRWFRADVVLYLARLFRFWWVGGSIPALMGEVEVGLMNGLQPLSGVKWERWNGVVVVEVRRFGSAMVLPAIWYCNRATIVWELLVIEGLLVWIDAEEGFEVRKGGLGEVYRRVCWWLQPVGSSELSRSIRDQRLVMLAVADSGTRWFDRGDGMVVVVVERLSLISDLFYLQFCVFNLLLVFGSVPRSQISLCSFESELLSRILAENWIWVIGLLLIRPSLVPAFSCMFDYQPVLRTLTSMSMSNARKGYPKGRPDQLCYLLVKLTQCIAHFCFCLDLLTSQLPLLRVRISSLSFCFMSPLMYVVVDVYPMGAAIDAVY